MSNLTRTIEQLERVLKVSRKILTELQDRLDVVNAEIDEQEEESWDLNQMRIEKSQLLYDIQETEADIADYVEKLGSQAT